MIYFEGVSRSLSNGVVWASGGMADTLVLGTSAARRRGSTPLLPIKCRSGCVCGNSSVVEHFLAKEGVASSNLVSRFVCRGSYLKLTAFLRV